MKCTIELITPEAAREYLNASFNNRPLSRAKVERYMAEMKAGRWRETHQGIAFEQHGFLIDGQHRLTAIVESGVAARMPVFRELDCEIFDAIDVPGQSRNASDLYVILGGLRERVSPRHFVAVARQMILGLRPELRVAAGDLARRAVRHERLILRALKLARKGVGCRSGVTAAFAKAALEHGEEIVFPLMERYTEHQFHGPFDPLRVLEKLIHKHEISGRGPLFAFQEYAYAVTAIRAAVEGRELKQLRAATEDFQPERKVLVNAEKKGPPAGPPSRPRFDMQPDWR